MSRAWIRAYRWLGTWDTQKFSGEFWKKNFLATLCTLLWAQRFFGTSMGIPRESKQVPTQPHGVTPNKRAVGLCKAARSVLKCTL